MSICIRFDKKNDLKKVLLFSLLLNFCLFIFSGDLATAANDKRVTRASQVPMDGSLIMGALDEGMNESLSLSKRVEALQFATNYPYQEVVDTLLIVLDMEINKASLPDSDIKNQILYIFIHSMVSALGDIATDYDYKDFDEVMSQRKKIENKFTDVQIEELEELIVRMSAQMKSRVVKLPSLPKDYSGLVSSEPLEKRLADFRVDLSKSIKGQPHVVEKLTRLRARDYFYGFREEPAFMWFLGPPGTGKDTAVRGYLQAIHKNNEAHKAHMYRVDPLRHEGDLWSLLGSGTGYVGSNEFPPILKFLVLHSGGRYIIEEIQDERGASKFKVVENPDWKLGDIQPGYYSPDSGIVYLDEFHDWAMKFKNAVVKKAAEYGGYWKINNPNGGLSEIYVPINLIAASNDGIELVTSREKNGERFGRPLSYPEMKQKADRVRNDPLAMRNSILRSNGSANSSQDGNGKGTSEELLNRIPEDHLVYFDPLSPEHLMQIAEAKLQVLSANIKKSKSGFENINLVWTPEVVKMLQEYHYVAEDQARPIENRVRSIIESTIISAAEKGLLKVSGKSDLQIDVVKNSDNTWKMKFNLKGVEGSATEAQLFDLDIAETLADRDRAPITDERIDQLADLPRVLKSSIVGQSHVLDSVARALLLSEDGRQGVRSAADAKEAARVFMFLGPTSTGKTETSKVMAEILFDTRLAAVTIDCTSLQTIEAMHRKFLGHKDAGGNAIASDFMKHYDRNNGRLVVVLDELANVKDKEVLNALFDLLREPVVTTFSDGTERIMSNVVMVITGNASQELLSELPQDLPEDVLREAWSDIYEQLEGDPQLRRSVLEKYFMPPFLARVGDDRIFFYKPLGYGEVRRLVQMKFESLVDNMAPREGQRGWHIRVPNKEAYIQLMQGLESHGFKLKEQGASIDHYVNEVLGKELRAQLLLNKVKDGETIELTLDTVTVKDSLRGHSRHEFALNVKTSDNRNIKFSIDGKPVEHAMGKINKDFLSTSAHESGHAVVGLALLSDFQIPTYVRILPGVTKIGEKWIYYRGAAGHEKSVDMRITRDYLVREIAALMGGTVAENLVVIGGMDSAGRSNDIERATAIAKRMILEFGMSKYFGKSVISEADISDKDKERLRKEVSIILKEGEALAKSAIEANKNLFIRLTNELGKKGELKGEDIKSIVAAEGLTRDYDNDFVSKAKKNAAQFNQKQIADRPGLKYDFVTTLNLINEAEIADVDNIIQVRKAQELSAVEIPANASLVGREPRKAKSCAQLLGN